MECSRGSDTIFDYAQGGDLKIKSNFLRRTNVELNETGVRVSINATTEGCNNDRANYTCTADLKNGKIISETKSLSSDPYGKLIVKTLCYILL